MKKKSNGIENIISDNNYNGVSDMNVHVNRRAMKLKEQRDQQIDRDEENTDYD